MVYYGKCVLLLRRSSTEWYILFKQEVRKSVTLVGLNIMRTCIWHVTQRCSISFPSPPPPLIPPLSLVWRCSNNIKSKMRVGDLGTRCSGDQKHNIIKHSNFLLLFRHAVTSSSSAIQCNTVLRCGSLELTPCSNGVPPLTGWLVVDDRSEEIWILSIVLLGCWWSVQCWRCVRFLQCVDKLAYTLIIFSGISVAWWRRWRRWVSDLGEVVCSGWLSGDFVVLDQASSFTSIWNTSSQKSSVGSM